MFMNPRLLRKQREGSTQRPNGSPFISTECLFFLFLYIPASPHLPATSLTPTTYLPPTCHLLLLPCPLHKQRAASKWFTKIDGCACPFIPTDLLNYALCTR